MLRNYLFIIKMVSEENNISEKLADIEENLTKHPIYTEGHKKRIESIFKDIKCDCNPYLTREDFRHIIGKFLTSSDVVELHPTRSEMDVVLEHANNLCKEHERRFQRIEQKMSNYIVVILLFIIMVCLLINVVRLFIN